MVSFTGFKKLAHKILALNELSGIESNAYRISHARTSKSGFSLGVMQWDYRARPKFTPAFIEDIMKNAVDAKGNAILSDSQIDAINEILKNNEFRHGVVHDSNIAYNLDTREVA